MRLAKKTKELDDWKGIGDSWARLSPSIILDDCKYDRHLTRHVALSSLGRPSSKALATSTPHDLGERIFAAILCLSPNIRELVIRCPAFRADTPEEAPRYETLSSLIHDALEDKLLGKNTLKHLETVEFNRCPHVQLFCLGGYIPCHQVRADTCPGLLRPASVVEVGVGLDIGGWQQVQAVGPNIRRVEIATQDPSRSLSAVCCSKLWGLEELRLSTIGRLAPADAVLDAALCEVAETLKLLNIRRTKVFWWQGPLKALPSLRRLEDLCVPIHLLGSPDDIKNGLLLHEVLPPRLKRLHITHYWLSLERLSPWATASEPGQEDAWVGPRDRSPMRKGGFVSALRAFATCCRQTHPQLESIIAQGREKSDPHRDGESLVLRGGELDELQRAFSEVGVGFRAVAGWD